MLVQVGSRQVAVVNCRHLSLRPILKSPSYLFLLPRIQFCTLEKGHSLEMFGVDVVQSLVFMRSVVFGSMFVF